MKAALVAIFLALIAPCLGSGDVVVRALYDEETTNAFCTDTEWDEIYDPGRRQLRGSRELNSCYWLCMGFFPGTCRFVYPWCWGYRRQLEDGQRELPSITDEVSCRTLTEEVEAKHQAAHSIVNPPCQAHISTRILDCYTVKRNGGPEGGPGAGGGNQRINQFRLLNAEDNNAVVVEELVQGSSFCGGDFDFIIEAMTGNGVDDVEFELNGPNQYRVTYPANSPSSQNAFALPASQFPSNGSSMKYEPGDYDLMATPNGFAATAQYLRFTILDKKHADCQ